MTIDELVELLNSSQGENLTSLQEWILRQAWQGKTYADMSCQAHYTAEHLRKIGADLWPLISEILEVNLTKSNIYATLKEYTLTPTQTELIRLKKVEPVFPSFSFPSGPLAADSPYYIFRSPVESLAFSEIQKPGSLIRIKAPSKFGKTSLILQIIDYAKRLDYDTVNLDFLQADKAVFKDLNKFLRWFSSNVSINLQLEPQLDLYWNEEIGSKVSCCLYFQKYILSQSDRPLVLTLNEVNRVFDYPEIMEDFFSLLRSWHEEAKNIRIFEKLRLIVDYSTEIYIPLKLNQSPFNIGLPLKLPPFNLEQGQELIDRYELQGIDQKKLKTIIHFLGGHPYLVQLTLYHLSCRETSLSQILQEAASEVGIYISHLRTLLVTLKEQPQLLDTFKELIVNSEKVKLEPLLFYKLDSLGLVRLNHDSIEPACELYRLYFREALNL